MTYLDWLSKQDGHNALVDLKNDITLDGDFPQDNKLDNMRRYLVSKKSPIRVFKVFYWSYGLYLKEIRTEVKQLEAEFLREIEEAGEEYL